MEWWKNVLYWPFPYQFVYEYHVHEDNSLKFDLFSAKIKKNSEDILGNGSSMKDISWIDELLIISPRSIDSSWIDNFVVESIGICSQFIIRHELVNDWLFNKSSLSLLIFFSVQQNTGSLWIRRWRILARSNWIRCSFHSHHHHHHRTLLLLIVSNGITSWSLPRSIPVRD